jgi:hypothetical protein
MPKGIYPHRKGYKLSDEHKKKIGQANAISKLGKKLKPHSKAWNNKIRKSLMGHPMSDKARYGLCKGDKAGYSAFHKRVATKRGTPSVCEVCNLSNKNTRYEWANLTGNYADIMDYKRMCKPCHMKYDIERSKKNGNKSQTAI